MSCRNTILIIDDDENEIVLTRRLFEIIAPELRVEWAAGGEEGLAKLRSGEPEPILILLDLKMSGISGIETLCLIREDEQLRHLRVVVITNSTLMSDKRNAMESGADAFLHKGLDMGKYSEDLKAQLEYSRKMHSTTD
jgi:CheY-like chemotaxis protein